jgi:tetratricopeptide (TPR) repeat protein
MVPVPPSPAPRARWSGWIWTLLAVLLGLFFGYLRVEARRERRRRAEAAKRWGEAFPHAVDGDVALFSGDWAAAERKFSDAIAAEPENPNHWYQRGLCRVELRRDREAAADFGEAIARASSPLQILRERARALARLGDWAAAEADAAKILEASDTDPDGIGVTGMILVGRGKPREAIPLLHDALVTLPENTDFLMALMRAQGATGDAEGVHATGKKLFRACIVNPVLNDEVIGLMADTGDRDAGLRPDFLVPHAGWEGRGYWWKGRLAWVRGDVGRAKEYYGEALKHYPAGHPQRSEVEGELKRLEAGEAAPRSWVKVEAEAE